MTVTFTGTTRELDDEARRLAEFQDGPSPEEVRRVGSLNWEPDVRCLLAGV
jgi:hypothetical protein